jgi:hypothetical protein
MGCKKSKNVRDEYDERYDLTKDLEEIAQRHQKAHGEAAFNEKNFVYSCAKSIALKQRQNTDREITCTHIPSLLRKDFESELNKFGVKYRLIAYESKKTTVTIVE